MFFCKYYCMFDYYWILSAEVLIWVQVEKAIASPKSLTVTDFSWVQVVVDMAMSRKPTAAEPQRCYDSPGVERLRVWESLWHLWHIFYRITFCTWSCCIWCPCRYTVTPTSINNSTLPCPIPVINMPGGHWRGVAKTGGRGLGDSDMKILCGITDLSKILKWGLEV